MTHRYEGLRDWTLLKGNLHVHSTRSDGGKTYEELIALYRGAGYDFLGFTDHRVFSEASALSTSDFLCIDGMELDGLGSDGTTVHATAVAPRRPIKPPSDLSSALDDAVDAGAFVMLAHPHWCGNSFALLQDARYHALEVYNDVCDDICAKGTSTVYWDWALNLGKSLLGVAVDDAHLSGPYARYARGWIKVRAEQHTTQAIAESLHAGRFYASHGPEFLDIESDGDHLIVRTSPVRSIWAVGRNGKGRQDRTVPTDRLVTEARINVAGWDRNNPCDYLRLEIVDAEGRRAWTNPL